MSLTDHHQISNLYSFLYEKCNKYPQILHIIDHHQISNDHTPKPLIYNDIRKIGSATTIVSEIIIHFYTKYKNSSIIIMDENIITLLLSAMMIDQSNNFNNINHITTINDIEIFNKLITLSNKLEIRDEENRKDYYNKLKELKSDVSDLSSIDMMNKDYKEWDDIYNGKKIKYGISSMFIPIGKWFEKDNDLVNEIIKFYNEKKLDLYITNHMYKNRRILIISEHKSLVKELSEYIYNSQLLYDRKKVNETSKVLNRLLLSNDQITSIHNNENGGKYAINDIKIKNTATRKILQPEIQSFFSKFKNLIKK